MYFARCLECDWHALKEKSVTRKAVDLNFGVRRNWKAPKRVAGKRNCPRVNSSLFKFVQTPTHVTHVEIPTVQHSFFISHLTVTIFFYPGSAGAPPRTVEVSSEDTTKAARFFDYAEESIPIYRGMANHLNCTYNQLN